MLRTRLIAVALAAGCAPAEPPLAPLTFVYALGRQYTGSMSNSLIIEAPAEAEGQYSFSILGDDVSASITQNVPYPLTSQTVDLTYATEGSYALDFRVNGPSGQPFLFETLPWQYSTVAPEAPIISFADEATNTRAKYLLVSDSRDADAAAIWVGGDIEIPAFASEEDGGYWLDLPASSTAVPVSLSSGDGDKMVEAKFRNIFDNEGPLGVPAEIFLKETPPSNCVIQALSTTVPNNKVSLKLSVSDTSQAYYSVVGAVGAVVDRNPFTDGDIVFVYIEPTPGEKQISVYVEDVAGNICLTEDLIITIDPNYQNEGIWVADHKYWTDTEDLTIDVFFDHYPDQEPLQIMITGDVTGPNTYAWLDDNQGINVSLSPSTSGSRRIYAQYKDVTGTESYLIAKRIFLKPSVTLEDTGDAVKNLVISNIHEDALISVTGCVETYESVAYQEDFACEPAAATVRVTYVFPDDSTLVKSVAP